MQSKPAVKSMTLQSWALTTFPAFAAVAAAWQTGDIWAIAVAVCGFVGWLGVLIGRIRKGDLTIGVKSKASALLVAACLLGTGCQVAQKFEQLSPTQKLDVLGRTYAACNSTVKDGMRLGVIDLAAAERFEVVRVKARKLLDAAWDEIEKGHDAEAALALSLAKQAVEELTAATPKIPKDDES